MSALKAQLFPRRSRVCAVLFLAFLRSLSGETPIGKPSSRLRAANIQLNPDLSLIIPADADGCVPCSPSSLHPLPVCVCIAGKTLCGDVETTCDDAAASSTPHDSSHVGHLDPALQGGGAVDATSRRTCFKPSCMQLNCSRVDSFPSATGVLLDPGFCPLLASTWAGPPSPFVNHIPADPFCGPGAYLQCVGALPKPTYVKDSFEKDPFARMIDSGGQRVMGAYSDAWSLAGWWCKTHPFWAIVSAVLWVPVLLGGSAMTFFAMFLAMWLIIPLFGLYCLFAVLYGAGLEFIEDMPLIAFAITSIVSVLIATRWARARYRKATTLPRTE